MEPLPDTSSIASLFSRLIADAEQFVRSEVRLYRAQILGRLDAAKFAVAMGFAALLIVHAAILTLLVGLILVLANHLGPGLATVIVVGVALVLAGVLGWLALSGIRKATGSVEDLE